MPGTYLIADTHFGHKGMCHFTKEDGSKVRPWTSVDEMDLDMKARWNAAVRPIDKVYVLGDVVINRKALGIMHSLHGDKVLIKGNHDIFRMNEYATYFRDIRGYHVMAGNLLSHIPVHPVSLGRWNVNIHGHLHSGRVMKDGVIDPKYHCVSAEHINYTPILFEKLLVKIAGEQVAS